MWRAARDRAAAGRDNLELVVSLIAGAIGGNAVGKASGGLNLGALLDSTLGTPGGAGGATPTAVVDLIRNGMGRA